MNRWALGYLLTLIVIFTSSSFTGCGGGAGGTAIGPDGGTVTSTDGKFTLTIPAGALAQNTQIKATSVGASELPTSISDMADVGFNYLLTPDGLTFAISSTGVISLSQDEAADYFGIGGALTSMVMITDESDALAYVDESMSSIDQTTGEYLLSAPIDHFSYDAASNGFISLIVAPAGVQGLVLSTPNPVDVNVTLQGRRNFNFGAYGEITESRFEVGTLKTVVPDFVTVTPSEVELDFSEDGQYTTTRTFEVTCTATGDDTISFYLDNPQSYILATGTGNVRYVVERQFGETIPVVCSNYGDDDDETVTDFSILPNPGSAAVGSDVTYRLGLLLFENHTKAYVTGTVADTNIAGPSPGSIDPFTSKKYVSNNQDMSFTCNAAGTTSVAFQMNIDDMRYWDSSSESYQTKNITLNATVPLTCTEDVPEPTGEEVDNSTSCQLTISWDYTDSFSPDGFEIIREVQNQGDWENIAEVAGTARSYVNAYATDSSLQLGITYCYRVRAFKDVEGQGRIYSDYGSAPCGTKQ